MGDENQAVTVETTQQKNRLYVRWSVSPQSLENLFAAQADQVSEARIVRGQGNFGFVTFASEEAATSALESLTANPPTLTTEPVVVEYASETRNTKSRGRGRNQDQAGDEKQEQNAKPERRQRKKRERKDYSQVEVPVLFPDLAEVKPSNLTTIQAGERKYRGARQTRRVTPKDGQVLETVELSPSDLQTSDFSIGGNELKIVSFNVKSATTDEGSDTRITAKVYDPVSKRDGDLYLRQRPDDSMNYKFFEIRTRLEAEEGERPKFDSKFVTIESLSVDRSNGAWDKLTIGFVTPIAPVSADE